MVTSLRPPLSALVTQSAVSIDRTVDNSSHNGRSHFALQLDAKCRYIDMWGSDAGGQPEIVGSGYDHRSVKITNMIKITDR